jgi:hypothetical protein
MTYGGYSDWFLPAIDQLNVLYENKVAIGGFNYSSPYWSSTENDFGSLYALSISFDGISSMNTAKNLSFFVRCIRTI